MMHKYYNGNTYMFCFQQKTFFKHKVSIKKYTQKPCGIDTAQKYTNNDAQHSMPILQVTERWFIARRDY